MDRLQQALDKYEQSQDATDLENLVEGPTMVRSLDSHFPPSFDFRLANDASLAVSDQATQVLSGLRRRYDDQYRDKKYVGAYSPESRRRRLELFHEKRKHRVWTRKVKYDVRKNFADTRMRVKGRFVKKEDEDLLKELLSII